MTRITVNIADRKYVPSLGKGPFTKVKIRKDLYHSLKSLGYAVSVVREENLGFKTTKKAADVTKVEAPKEEKVVKKEEPKKTEEVKETPEVKPVVEETPEVTTVEAPEVNENDAEDEILITALVGEGLYTTTTGRDIEFTEEEAAIVNKEDVTKSELKAILDAKEIKYLYKDNLKTLLGKFGK